MNKSKFFIDEVIVTDLTENQKKIVAELLEGGENFHCVYGRLQNFSMMEFLNNCRDYNDKLWKTYCELRFKKPGPFDLSETFINTERDDKYYE